MKTAKMLTVLVLASAIMVWTAEVSEAAPMGTAFSYQGHLYDNNDVADGLYDFSFRLYDSNTAGTQLGGDVNKPDVDVITAQFTVELDFDGGVFDGNAVWLEIGIRPGELGDSNAYTLLSPRQEVTPTPYALHTRWLLVDTALDNVFAGEGAGASNTTGSYNSAVGANSLSSNTTGSGNSAMGYEALRISTGNNNSAVGNRALYSNTTGNANSAVGYYALWSNTTGGSNSAMGNQALLANTTGNSNSAMGMYALRSNTTGLYNSAMGVYALRSNTTGNDNSAMGDRALFSNTEGYYNSAVGSWAGYSNSTGSGNVFLGYKAGYNETGSNKLYIANDSADANVLIYGDFSTGNIGIGTTTPAEKLDVAGTGQMTGFKLPTGASSGYVLTSDASGAGTWQAAAGGGDNDWMVSGNDMYSIPSGNVGIGDATPSEKLEVDGNININSVYKIGGETVLSNSGTDNIFVGVGAGENNTGNYNSAMGYQALWSNNEGNRNSAMGYRALRYNTTGSWNSAVGYGALRSNTGGGFNSAMGYGALRSNTGGGSNSAMGYYALRFNTTGSYNSAMGYQALQSTSGNQNTAMGYEAGRNSTGSGNVFLGYQAGYNETGDNKLYIANDSADANVLIYGDFSSGNVGIGMTSPSAKLEVGGTAGVDGIKFPDGTLQTTAAENRWKISGTDIYYDAGKVEIRIEANKTGLEISEPSGFGTLSIGGDDIDCDEMLYLNYYSKWKVIVGSPGAEGLKVYGNLEVDGPAFIPDAYNYVIASGRDVYVNSSGHLGRPVSSKRYKENIAPLEDDFSKILAAQPVAFVWKESKESDIGLIAEDIDELGLRNLVIYDAKGRPESVRYKFLSLYLLEVLKDLDNSIKELKAENESLKKQLKAENESLKRRLVVLEKMMEQVQFAVAKEVQQ